MLLKVFLVFFFFYESFSYQFYLNTTSGEFQGKDIIIRNVRIQHYFGIPYGEKPVRFELPVLKKYNSKGVQNATERKPGCLQASGGLSYGPFELSDMYNEDCLTLNIFIPEIFSPSPKAIMVFCHGGSNQVGAATLFDGSAIAAIGDVIVITINYRLNILGFLTPGSDIMSGNYGLHDQILALKWISMNADKFYGDPKRITYVGHSAGAANALLIAMSKRSEGLIARVIAQSGCPLNQWAVDRSPMTRFNNVIESHDMKKDKKKIQSNIDQLKNNLTRFHYVYQSNLEISPYYPFPTVDNDIITDNLEELVRMEPLVNVDILIGVTADEALYFAEEHMFNYYVPKSNRTHASVATTTTTTTTKTATMPKDFDEESSIMERSIKKPTESEQPKGFIHFRQTSYIKNYLKTNYPGYLCRYEDIRRRYMPDENNKHNLSETAHLYTNLVSDLMFYYDLVRFLRQRLLSNTSRSTYVYYYTNPPLFDLDNLLRRIPDMIGHFAELDLTWGVPFFNSKTSRYPAYPMNISYKPEEVEFSLQLIRYWTNFAKTGNANGPEHVSVYWPLYENTNKSYIILNVNNTHIDNDFLEERFEFWNTIIYNRVCTSLHWYHICLLVGILLIVLILITIYIFYNAKRLHRNIKPTEITTNDVVTTYRFLPSVVS